ncbi:MAG TPA: metallophosphoesterase [Croceibacterium sp.]|nr:metallophosphoesterase [Croceibacterium sp.]
MARSESGSDLSARWRPRAYLEARLAALLRRGPAPSETAPGERVYAIGDVHGRLDLLRRLLRTIEADAHGHPLTRIVVLGDLIDRGPHSRQVLELLRRRAQREPERVVVLLGNHEDLMLASVRGEAAAQRAWLRAGGEATLRSYRVDPGAFAALPAAERARLLRRVVGAQMLGWLAARPLAHRSGDYFFCHAGVRPGVSLSKQRREDLLWIRRAFLASDTAHGAVIVHGHSVSAQPEVAPNRIGIDTGAHRSGELTAVGLQGPCRWLLSTKRGYLTRADLEAARAWSVHAADQPVANTLRGRRAAPVPDSEAA